MNGWIKFRKDHRVYRDGKRLPFSKLECSVCGAALTKETIMEHMVSEHADKGYMRVGAQVFKRHYCNFDQHGKVHQCGKVALYQVGGGYFCKEHYPDAVALRKGLKFLAERAADISADRKANDYRDLGQAHLKGLRARRH